MNFTTLLFSAFMASASAQLTAATNTTTPTAPALSYLYTSYVDISTPITMGAGPLGTRLAIPITGGNFTGPLLNGTILNLGADWMLIDPKTGIYAPDTRYQFLTSDAANIFVRSTGSQVPLLGEIHLRFVFETGSVQYYWLNNVIGESLLLPRFFDSRILFVPSLLVLLPCSPASLIQKL